MKDAYAITDPRHPLQMDLSAAEMKVRKWKGIAAETHDDEKHASARALLAFHQGQAEGLKRRIAAHGGATRRRQTTNRTGDESSPLQKGAAS